jgi:uncharacterized protein YkwD
MLLVLTVGVSSGLARSSGGEVVGLPSLEAQIVVELNAVRAARGLRPLSLARGLQASARNHSRTMLQQGFFRHDSPDGTRFSDRIRRFYPAHGFRSWSVGENLLYHTAELPPAEAIAAWLRSPPHRRNMLSPQWREVGVGALWSAAAPGEFVDASVSVVTVDFGVRSRKAGIPASR